MAAAAHTKGDYNTALDYLKQALAIQRKTNDRAGEVITLNHIAGIYDGRNDFDAALDYLKQTLAILKEIDNSAGEDATLNNITQLCVTLLKFGNKQMQHEERREAAVAWIAVLTDALTHMEELYWQIGENDFSCWEEIQETIEAQIGKIELDFRCNGDSHVQSRH